MISTLELGLLPNAIYEDSPGIPGWNCERFHSWPGEGMEAGVFIRGGRTVIAFKGMSLG